MKRLPLTIIRDHKRYRRFWTYTHKTDANKYQAKLKFDGYSAIMTTDQLSTGKRYTLWRRKS